MIANAELKNEEGIEMCKAAEKDLARKLKELAKLIAQDQAELKKYQPGGC